MRARVPPSGRSREHSARPRGGVPALPYGHRGGAQIAVIRAGSHHERTTAAGDATITDVNEPVLHDQMRVSAVARAAVQERLRQAVLGVLYAAGIGRPDARGR